jgi:hypothetical protein
MMAFSVFPLVAFRRSAADRIGGPLTARGGHLLTVFGSRF